MLLPSRKVHHVYLCARYLHEKRTAKDFSLGTRRRPLGLFRNENGFSTYGSHMFCSSFWHTYAVVNHLHPWTTLNTNTHHDLQLFLAESRALFIHLAAWLLHMSPVIKPSQGAGKTFSPIHSTLHGPNPIATPPGSSFLRESPTCVSFGDACLSCEELRHAAMNQSSAIFFHPMAMNNTTGTKWFNFLDIWLKIPNPDSPVRVFALYKRGQCRLMNSWFDNHELLQMHVLCCPHDRFHFQTNAPYRYYVGT